MASFIAKYIFLHFFCLCFFFIDTLVEKKIRSAWTHQKLLKIIILQRKDCKIGFHKHPLENTYCQEISRTYTAKSAQTREHFYSANFKLRNVFEGCQKNENCLGEILDIELANNKHLSHYLV